MSTIKPLSKYRYYFRGEYYCDATFEYRGSDLWVKWENTKHHLSLNGEWVRYRSNEPNITNKKAREYYEDTTALFNDLVDSYYGPDI